MYFYTFSTKKNKICQIILDDTGIPIDSYEIKVSDAVGSEVAKELDKDPTLLIFGEAITQEDLANGSDEGGRKPVHLYFEHNINDKISTFQSDKDWEQFFKEHDIEYEVRRSPAIYYH